MPRLTSLVFLVVHALGFALAAPRWEWVTTTSSICDGYLFGVIIQELPTPGDIPVYNHYVQTTHCMNIWVESSTNPDPPKTISPHGITYECEVPVTEYYCGSAPIATCCGKRPEYEVVVHPLTTA